ncbi:MAG: FecR family protein, partial [Deltaproteobacteria bacterium]|nr:FecR family protein [Kofleriaceae bacterium]
MHRTLGMCVVCAVLFAAGACNKKNEASQGAAPAEGTATASAGTKAPTTATAGAVDPGIEAGPIEREAGEGPAAVLAAVSGTVEVRRVGETAYQAAAADTPLYPGDQVRTGEQSTATIAMADESVIEVAEVSTVGVASREGGADPASSAAVLAGLARFTVTSRAPGEGAFKVYTPGGVVMTRAEPVGVESGAVDVVGLAATAAEPVAVET